MFSFLHKFLDKYLENKTSRQLQNFQHSIGGLYGVLLIATGSFLTRNLLIGILLGIFSIIVQRISSEISYRTQFKIQEEIHIFYKNDKHRH